MSPQTVPVIVCPECAGLEPGAFIGEASGDVVVYPNEHFADRRGYLHCFRCGAVWDVLYELPEPVQVGGVPPSLFASDAAKPDALGSVFAWADFGYYRRLLKSHARYGFDNESRATRRMRDRVYDAEALCGILDLPSDIKAAVLHHVRVLSERADFRTLAAASNGTVRSEAHIVATVALVLERFSIERPKALGKMLSAFRFKRGEPTITLQEFSSAYLACAEWFGQNVWRDGVEDAIIEEDLNT